MSPWNIIATSQLVYSPASNVLFHHAIGSADTSMIGHGAAVVSALANSGQQPPSLTPLSHVVSMLAISGGAFSPTAIAEPSSSNLLWTPQGQSVLYMAIAMAFHYLGYSLARSITVSLFTSSSTGYTSPAAFPFANAFVSPMALVLLVGYSFVLDRYGPAAALTQSTIACAGIVTAAALAIASSVRTGLLVTIGSHQIPAAKLISGPLFVFREAYVQLLTSQYWSFMASALTPNQSARYFGPIAGLTSLASAVAGYTVSPLVKRIGLTGTLMGTGVMLMCSLVTASIAYRISRQHGFEPTDVHKKSKHRNASSGQKKEDVGMIQQASRLFRRVPVLKALFLEILASQGLATLLNVCFVTCLGTAIPNDDDRAGWVGKFYSIINVITMLLQFGVLPPLMTVIEPKDLWRVIPIVSLLFTGFQACQKNPTLYVVSSSLLVMKISEYSARRMLDEMIFVPLDFESRYVGKEIIGVFGYRFGKSLMSLLLSGITAIDGNFGLQKLSVLSTTVCLAWMRTAWSLSNMVPTRAEAEAAYTKQKRN